MRKGGLRLIIKDYPLDSLEGKVIGYRCDNCQTDYYPGYSEDTFLYEINVNYYNLTQTNKMNEDSQQSMPLIFCSPACLTTFFTSLGYLHAGPAEDIAYYFTDRGFNSEDFMVTG